MATASRDALEKRETPSRPASHQRSDGIAHQTDEGTEMFWDDPEGAESILHIRAAALSEDGRLDDYFATRPGYPFLRRSTLTNLSA